MKKTLKIYDHNYNWHSFEFEKTEDIEKIVFEKFAVKLGSRTSIGDGTSIGDNEKIKMSIYINGSKHPVIWWQKD